MINCISTIKNEFQIFYKKKKQTREMKKYITIIEEIFKQESNPYKGWELVLISYIKKIIKKNTIMKNIKYINKYIQIIKK